MSSPLLRKLSHACLGFLLTAISGVSQADDTEIYFSGAGNNPNDTVIRPNVLLILDTSISMGSAPATGGLPKISQLRTAATSVLQNMQDVNVGLMRFTYSEGGPVLFPITYIDQNLNNVVGETDFGLDFSNRLSIGNDDAEETLEDGDVSTTSTVLNFNDDSSYTSGNIGINASNSEDDAHQTGSTVTINATTVTFSSTYTTAGVRFRSVAIPQGARILSASLTFTKSGSNSGTAGETIYGQKVDSAAVFSTASNDITGRTKTTASKAWSPSTGTTEQTPDISNVVQEIVCRGATTATTGCPSPPYTGNWASGNNMGFIINRTSGTRTFYSMDGTNTANKRPTLTVSYETVAVARTLEVGVRFEDIRIPQGATVTDAHLEFTPTQSDTGSVTWTIKGHKPGSGESKPLDQSTYDLTARGLTSAYATWAVPSWTADTPVETTDTDASHKLKDVMQEVVNTGNWCGGNSMTFLITLPSGSSQRKAYSYDGNPTYAPRLSYTIDTSTGTTGCVAGSASSQVAVESDDAEEDTGTGAVNFNDPPLNLGPKIVGLRFQNVSIPQGAKILDATLELAPTVTSSGSASFDIYGQAADNPSTFTANTHDLSARTKTSSKFTWAPRDWVINTGTDQTLDDTLNPSDVRAVVQEIVCRGVTTATSQCPSTGGNWQPGNAMIFIIQDGTGERIANSYNSDPAQAPRLHIRYQTQGTIYKTARDRMIEVVSQLQASDATPSTEALFEAARYWRGDTVSYGKGRDNNSSTRVSHPGSYCSKDAGGTIDCHGATVNATSPKVTDKYGQYYPTGCTATNLDSASCKTMSIEGSPTYISPFSSTLTCQNNYQVFLSDGAANSNSSTVETNIKSASYANVASCLANNSTFKKTGDLPYTYSAGMACPLATTDICGVDLVKAMKTKDQSSYNGSQTVTTFTVGFDVKPPASDTTPTVADTCEERATQYLKDLANVGGGQFYSADNADDIVNAFSTILSTVKASPTSFVSPSLATNAFNRLLSRDEVYFGLFTPAFQRSWPGNVKKYNICVSSGGRDQNTATTSDNCTLGDILDYNYQPAIDSATEKFKTTATSVWSSPTVDGRETTLGGSGGQITDYTTRIIYSEGATAPASGTALNTATHIFSQNATTIANARWNHSDLTTWRSLMCPNPSTDTATANGLDCQARMLWLLGKVYNTASTDTSATTRWSVNDVLHSSPVVITYGGTGSTFYDRLVVGTNDGGLRFINGTTGAEEWMFLPQTLFGNIITHFTNPQGAHLYGLDVTPTVRVIDNNKNGIIEPEDVDGKRDKVYVYIAMRDGGNDIYALDVTPAATLTNNTTAIVPKFLWRIQGGPSGTTGFGRMGNSWSQPRVAHIAITSGSTVSTKDVLIFGGGYDDSLDALDHSGAGPNYNFGLEGSVPNLGNALYIVDADTGAVILNISNAASTSPTFAAAADADAMIKVPNMFYSIPSRITIMDSNDDGVDDRLYFGDTAGQIWRVDLAADISTSGSNRQGSTIVGRLANLSTAGSAANERRFFEPPSIVQVKDTNFSSVTNGEYDYVMIGSGNRGHPLDSTAHDRFYALRDKFIDGMPDASPQDNLADSGYPKGDGTVITNASTDLIDVTTRVFKTTDSDITEIKNSLGWYFDFNEGGHAGEKVLSGSTAIAGAVLFTTYDPLVAARDACSANVGGGAAYNLNILTTKSQIDWDEDGTLEDTADRRRSLGGGIPSDVVPVFTKEGVVGIVGIEGGAAQLGSLSGLPRYRTYWYEEN